MDRTGFQKYQLLKTVLIVRGPGLTSQLFSMLNICYDWSAKLIKEKIKSH
jgi:hypothetical protein